MLVREDLKSDISTLPCFVRNRGIGRRLIASPIWGQEGPPPGPPGAASELPRGPSRPPGPPPGPAPRLPDNAYYGVNAGKPDLGGLAKGMWRVPYIIDMQKQGRAPDGGPVVVPFTALGKKLFDERTKTIPRTIRKGSACLPAFRA